MRPYQMLSITTLLVALTYQGAVSSPAFIHGQDHQDNQKEASADFYAPPQYKYDYAVHDPETHDIKSQWEHRDGDLVKGAYSLMEPDGSMRLVEYHSDKDGGFNAIVSRSDGSKSGGSKYNNLGDYK